VAAGDRRVDDSSRERGAFGLAGAHGEAAVVAETDLGGRGDDRTEIEDCLAKIEAAQAADDTDALDAQITALEDILFFLES
jgi:hypothetical protein